MLDFKSRIKLATTIAYFAANLSGSAADAKSGKYDIGTSVLDLPTQPALTTSTLPKAVDSIDYDNDGITDVKVNHFKEPAQKFFKEVAELSFSRPEEIEKTVQAIQSLITLHYGPYDPSSAKAQEEYALSGQSLEKNTAKLNLIKARISQGEILLREAKTALTQPFNLEDLSARTRSFLAKPELSGLKLFQTHEKEMKSLNSAFTKLTKDIETINARADGGIKRSLGHDVNDLVGHTLCTDRAALLAAGLRARNEDARCIAFSDHVAVVLPRYMLISMDGSDLKKYEVKLPKDKGRLLSISISDGQLLEVEGLEGAGNFPTDRAGSAGQEAQRAKNIALKRILQGENR